MIQTMVDDYKLQHVYRKYNKPTHIFARYAWKVDSIVMWETTTNFVGQAI